MYVVTMVMCHTWYSLTNMNNRAHRLYLNSFGFQKEVGSEKNIRSMHVIVIWVATVVAVLWCMFMYIIHVGIVQFHSIIVYMYNVHAR